MTIDSGEQTTAPSLRARLAAVPPFTLGFVVLCLLQSGLDRVDPTSGAVERLLGLFLLAFAVSGLVAALVGGPDAALPLPGGAAVGLFLRGGVAVVGVLLLAVLLAGGRLNPLVDLQFVVALLLLALLCARHPYDPADRTAAFLARWALPLGAAALLVSVPVVVAKVLALP